jgi:hypothetical protein
VAELIDFDEKKIELADGALGRFRALLAGCEKMLLFQSANDEQMQGFCGDCLDNIECEIKQGEEKIAALANVKDEKSLWRQQGLTKQLETMRKLKRAVETTGTPYELMQLLLEFEVANDRKSDNDITTPIIRSIIFMRAMAGHENYYQEFSKLRAKEKPSKGDLEQMVEFVNNVLKQHVCPALNLTAAQNKKLSKILNVNGLVEEIGRLNQMLSGRKRELLCVPSREVLGELSGYYGDACWTAVEDSMKNNPKMTAVAFVSNPDEKKHRKLAGATLLIETAIGGEKVMIIRGLNPKQNLIERLSAEKFTEEFIESYIMSICLAQGVTKILCPLHNEGALTNRPSIAEYLKKKYSTARRVKLDEEIDFNGYNITDSCVVLRELG